MGGLWSGVDGCGLTEDLFRAKKAGLVWTSECVGLLPPPCPYPPPCPSRIPPVPHFEPPRPLSHRVRVAHPSYIRLSIPHPTSSKIASNESTCSKSSLKSACVR